MSEINVDAMDDISKDDSVVRFLAAYDQALVDGAAVDSLGPPVGSDAEHVAQIERLEATVRRLHRLSGIVPLASDSTNRSQSLADSSSPANRRMPTVADPEAALPFSKLGRFEIVRELGAGGLGVVFLAHDPVLNRFVALKIPRPEALFSHHMRGRFLREAQAAARLTHPNLVPVHEVGEAGSVCFIAAAYCEGSNLAEWLSQQTSPVSDAVAAHLVAQLADGMEHAHRHGVLHRDLKPANVILEAVYSEVAPAGPKGDWFDFTPRITDFGLAKLDQPGQSEPRSEALLGTLSYMAPEQANPAAGPSDHRADVYGLGAIMYEIITGVPPYRGSSDADTLRKLLYEEFKPPRAVRPTLSRVLEAICCKCLQKNPLHRYSSASALAADLRRFLAGESTQARPLNAAQQFAHWTRRRPATAALVSLIALATVAFISQSWIYIGRLKEANAQAQAMRSQAEQYAATSENQRTIANGYLYAMRMKTAFQALENGQTALAEELVAEYAGDKQFSNIRGFEWYLLNQRLHSARRVIEHPGEVFAVVYSPDGRSLVSGAEDGRIRFFDAQRGEEIANMAAHKSCVNGLAYSPDGSVLASASCDQTIKLWDATTHELLDTLDGHPDNVQGIAFSPGDGSRLASCGNDSTIRVWDLATREIVQSLETGKSTINSVAWKSADELLATGAGPALANSGILVWNLNDNSVSATSIGSLSLATEPGKGGGWLGLADGTIHQFANDGVMPAELRGHSGGVECLAISPDGKLLASGGRDSNIRLWDRVQGICLKTLSGHHTRVQSLAFSPTGTTLASASFDRTIRVWDLDQIEPREFAFPLDGPRHDSAEFRLQSLQGQTALSSDFSYLSAITRPNEVSVFRIKDGSLQYQRDLSSPAQGLGFVMGKPILVGLTIDPAAHEVADLDVSQGISVANHRRLAKDALCAVYTGDGKYAAVIEEDAVHILDLATGELIHSISKTIALAVYSSPVVCSSPDGMQLGIRATPEQSWVFDAPTKSLSAAPANVIGLSSGANMLAIERGLAVALLEGHSLKQLALLPCAAGIGRIAFSPDTRTIAIDSGDGISLWNVATGQRMARFELLHQQAIRMQFSADSRKLAVITTGNAEAYQNATYFNPPMQIDGSRFDARLHIWSGLAD